MELAMRHLQGKDGELASLLEKYVGCCGHAWARICQRPVLWRKQNETTTLLDIVNSPCPCVLHRSGALNKSHLVEEVARRTGAHKVHGPLRRQNSCEF